MTGPGKVAALSNLYAAKIDADAKVQSAEVTKNTEVGNTEAQINAKIAASNFDRMAKVDEYNADMKQEIDEIKVNAADKAASRGASIIQNALQRVASTALANQMQGDSGIVSRTDFMKTHEEWDQEKYMEYIKKWYPAYYEQQTT